MCDEATGQVDQFVVDDPGNFDISASAPDEGHERPY